MASIETYQERIAAVRASIETLKTGNKLTITRLDGTKYEVKQPSDLDFNYGTVIADSEGRVYLRTAGMYEQHWRAAVGTPQYRCHESLFSIMCQRAAWGTTYKFLNETGQRGCE